MGKLVAVVLLLLSSTALAQAPRIDSMVVVSEDSGWLDIFGRFGTTLGAVEFDTGHVNVLNWSDSVVRVRIPRIQGGGGVTVHTDSAQSNTRLLTSVMVAGSITFNHDVLHQSQYELLWRFDYQSYFLNHRHDTSDLLIKVFSLSNPSKDSVIYQFTKGRLAIFKRPQYATIYIPLDSEFIPLRSGNVSPSDHEDVTYGVSIGFPPPKDAIVMYKGVILLSPLNTSFQPDTTNLYLSWIASPYLGHYHIQCSADSTLSVIAIDTVIDGSSLHAIGLKRNATYFWRVSGINSEGESRWSPVWHFTTSTDPAEVRSRIATEGFVCSPNPASSTIHLTLPAANNGAEIILYDLTGRALRRHLLNGESTFDLAVADLPNGVYAVTLVAAKSRETRLITVSH